MSNLILTVVDTRMETPLIRAITLRAADGATLPAFTAGAHLRVAVPGQKLPRCYSLVCLDDDAASFDAPVQYRLGVRLEDPGSGGSRHMHALKVGDTLEVDGPHNDFPLENAPDGELGGEVVLVAGGIGITPITAMAAALRRAGRPFQLHYYGRSRDQMAFLEPLAARHGQVLHVHPDDEADCSLALGALLDAMEADQPVYVCGPRAMIDALREAAGARQWLRERVRFELFTAPEAQAGDTGFEVELRQSGMALHVPADKTILEVLEEAGCDPLCDCRRGECGVCQATVLEGTPDHRDCYLSDEERAAGDVMQICVSRSRSPRLVLDL
ncbi:oxidoreductase [Allopusillimonas soli]|uniref:Oxidoreductase n=1 Tax=Allopusillimonas soli TaxID=659016 RepID=A0A853FC14_9BURK|nr:PDR/VanB family oxidoreductase [Allopusillimonas soli]NYT37308.1 oxidoreductase [Allopusillimonas soli]TEA74701.1 oxidoreductase [Allopusillimonas soli]